MNGLESDLAYLSGSAGQFRRDTELSYVRMQFYPNCAIIGGIEVDEKMVKLICC